MPVSSLGDTDVYYSRVPQSFYFRYNILPPIKPLASTDFCQIASAYAEAFDALLDDAYQQIGESLPLLSQYQALFQRNPSMRKVLALIYNDILEFHKKALKDFRQRSKLIS